MKISAEWLPTGPNAAPEEAATVASIRISIDGHSATDVRIDRRNQIADHIVAPAYPLAEGIAYRWWTLLYGRGRLTRLRQMRSGFALPDILIKAVGNGRIEIACDPYVYENPPLEFVTKASESVQIRQFESDMMGFVSAVVARLAEEHIEQTLLSDRWSKIVATLNDAEEREFCAAAGAFGVDPYACDDRAASVIDTATSLFEGDDLAEFLAGTNTETAVDAIGWVKRAEQQEDDSWCLLPAIEDCRRELAFRRTPGAPWNVGYVSARKVRKQLRLSDSEPVGDLGALTVRLGNSHFHATEPSTSGIRGVSHLFPSRPRAIVGGSRYPTSLLFATTRTFGDAIHFGGPRPSPVTYQTGTYRQALNRAFAAEFLAPLAPVFERYSRGEPVEEIAADYGVSEIVIFHQIENQRNNLSAG